MSRDINRIKPFMNKLTDIWEKNCPDWRFGQFISNIESYIGKDIFFIEEKEMMSYIENYFKDFKR
jgi:hypothetical protein